MRRRRVWRQLVAGLRGRRLPDAIPGRWSNPLVNYVVVIDVIDVIDVIVVILHLQDRNLGHVRSMPQMRH